jgi:hypothetical protein
MSSLDKFKQKPSPQDRSATTGFKDRWNDWIETLKEKQTLEQNDLIDWRLGWGLGSRTFRQEYLDPAIQRGIIEPFGRPAKYRVCNSYKEEHIEQPKRKLSAKAEEFFEKCRIKDEMKSGPCKDKECPPGSEEECTYCSLYANYTGKNELPGEYFEE